MADTYMILSWTGFPLLIIGYIVIGCSYSNSLIVLTLTEHFFYALSLIFLILIKQIEITSVVICSCVYTWLMILIVTITVIRFLEVEYYFLREIPLLAKKLVVICWLSSMILFILMATDAVDISFHLGSSIVHESFYIELSCAVIGLFKYIIFMMEPANINRDQKLNSFGVLVFGAGCAIWLAGLVNMTIDHGDHIILNNIARGEISFFGLIFSIVYLIRKRQVHKVLNNY